MNFQDWLNLALAILPLITAGIGAVVTILVKNKIIGDKEAAKINTYLAAGDNALVACSKTSMSVYDAIKRADIPGITMANAGVPAEVKK